MRDSNVCLWHEADLTRRACRRFVECGWSTRSSEPCRDVPVGAATPQHTGDKKLWRSRIRRSRNPPAEPTTRRDLGGLRYA